LTRLCYAWFGVTLLWQVAWLGLACLACFNGVGFVWRGEVALLGLEAFGMTWFGLACSTGGFTFVMLPCVPVPFH